MGNLIMGILEDLLNQIHKWPISLVTVVALSFSGIALKMMEAVKNKYIPSLLMFQGSVIYILVSDRTTIDPGIPYPNVVFGLYGCILGMIAWMFHGVIWKVVCERLPGLKNGHTEVTKKPPEDK